MSDRRVHFAVPLHQIEYLQWELDSLLARDGSDWCRMGLDRQRFQDRIERVSETLNQILDVELRQRIYKERFENFVTPEEQANTSIVDSGHSETRSTLDTTVEPGENIGLKKVALQPDLETKSHSTDLKNIEQIKTRRRRRKRRRKKK